MTAEPVMSDDDWAALSPLASALGIARRELVRQAIHQWMEAHVERPDQNRCPICGKVAVGLHRYPVTLLGGGGFTDDDGNHHFHDPNNSGSWSYCVDGHEWHGPRCWCGWGAEAVADRAAEQRRRAAAWATHPLNAHNLTPTWIGKYD